MELADVDTKPFFIIFENLWQTSEALSDCRKGNIMFILKQSKKEHPESY